MCVPGLHPLPLAQVMRLVGEELRDLRDEGRHVEDAIAHALLDGETSRREALGNLQKIDLIVQTLSELSLFVGDLVAHVPEGCAVDVHHMLERITLRDLARKLAGGPRKAIVDEMGRVSGEVDLF